MQILTKPNIGPAGAIADAVGRAPSGERPTLRLAYLASQYPAVPHTFIFNEIRGLRKLGFDISTASINACDRPVAQLPEIERTEQATTFYIKPSGWFKALQAVISSVVRNPVGTLHGLLFTMRLGRGAKRYFYFIEALMVGMWMREKGLEHLHVHFGTAAASVGMLVSKTFPITYSVTIHGPDEFYEVSNSYLPEKVAAARFVFCIGSYARSQVMKVSPSNQWKKIEVVPLGWIRKVCTHPASGRSPLRDLVHRTLGVSKRAPHPAFSRQALSRRKSCDSAAVIGRRTGAASLEQRILEEGLTGQ